jgi:hypothetical protein
MSGIQPGQQPSPSSASHAATLSRWPAQIIGKNGSVCETTHLLR